MELIKTHYNFIGYIDTRIGGRAENQDSRGFADTSHGLLVVVCDGMGGGPSGKLASSIAVQATIDHVAHILDESVPRDQILKDAVIYAHNLLLDRQRTDPSSRGMGTTLTALLINSQSAYVAHVGDSRVYQFRGGHIVFKTTDHSYVGELVQKGDLTEEQARLSARSNIITRCLGGRSNSTPEIDGPLPYLKGDRFMLCTDGIWGMMPEPELIKLVAKTPSLSGAADATIIAVDEKGRNEGNHHDNLTIALLDTTEDSILKVPMSKTSKIIIGVLGALLALSLLFNFIQAGKSGSNEENQQQLKELQQQLNQTKDSVNYLKGQIQGNKDKVPVNVFVNDDSHSGKNTEETSKVGAQDDAQSSPTQGNIAKILDNVIKQLEAAKGMKNGPERDNIRLQVISDLKKLSTMDASHKGTYEKAVKELNKPITKQAGSASEGQYKAIINLLTGIKKS